MNTWKIIYMTLSALLLIGFVYGLLYELYVLRNRLVIFLFLGLIVADLIVFIKLFWNITASRRDDA
ncbi:hypothetical protein LQ567_00975 [Niabella pedocola]|uniref:Uncharacterized protein n=1 Tax=Niabella pedocola TaxID=1752077 RepID=A0ABS8PKA9_9BACT|nr:hypothetical protein [Niabella pedocola]MCD2421315.1 hypothetical protein [Niabella pedocola]